MLYQDATDKALDEDIYLDLNEAERAGSTENVQIVSQIKRYRGKGQAPDAWPSTRRFHVTRDAELRTVRSQQVADLGQVDMANPKALTDFVTWAVKTYPADKYALILSDHGMGWPGGMSDPTVAGPKRSVPLASKLDNMMFLNELDQALGAARTQTGIDKFELVGLDACLMSQMEVLDAVAPHAKYAVVSEETEPSLGWAYTSFLNALQANPAMTGGDLAKAIVKTYIQDDQRIVDDQARAELVGNRGSPLDALFGGGSGTVPSAAETAREMGQDVTLTAIDLQTFPALMDSLNKLSHSLQKIDPRVVAKARSNAQAYTSIFGESVPPSFIDLGHFVQLLTRNSRDSALADAAQRFLAALKTTVIAEKHGAGKPGSTGISIYFPNSQLYNSPYAGPTSYTAVANRFAKESQWDDFLAYFYTGRDFAATTNTVAVPQRGVAVRAPVTSQNQVSPVRLSAKETVPGKPVQIAVDIDGNNVGYVKLFAGFYDKASNSLNVTDQDYLQSSESREESGVYYPVWPESGKYTVRFNWEPIVYAINDGKKSVPVLFKPETYGRSQEQAVYRSMGRTRSLTAADRGRRGCSSATSSCARRSASPARMTPAPRARSLRRSVTRSRWPSSGWTWISAATCPKSPRRRARRSPSGHNRSPGSRSTPRPATTWSACHRGSGWQPEVRVRPGDGEMTHSSCSGWFGSSLPAPSCRMRLGARAWCNAGPGSDRDAARRSAAQTPDHPLHQRRARLVGRAEEQGRKLNRRGGGDAGTLARAGRLHAGWPGPRPQRRRYVDRAGHLDVVQRRFRRPR